MMILCVNLEMFREVVDTFAEKRDLHFRGTRVAVVCAIVPDDSGLAVLGQCHDGVLHARPRNPLDSLRSLGASPRLRSGHQTVVCLIPAKSKTQHSKSGQPPGAKIRKPVA